MKKKNKKWSAREEKYLRLHYADEFNADIAVSLRRSIASVYSKAEKMGLSKSHQFKASAGKRVSESEASRASRFAPGHKTHNKGKRWYQYMSTESRQLCQSTQFKPGRKAHNEHPVGYERVRDDGYVWVKAEPHQKMVMKHILVWEQHYGKRPQGTVICFLDGNRLNCSIENLVLRTRSEMMRLQILSEQPEQRQLRVRNSMATRNELIRKDKMRIRWGLEPRTNLVKRWYAP